MTQIALAWLWQLEDRLCTLADQLKWDLESLKLTFALQTMVMRPSRMITIPKYLVCHFVVKGPTVRACVQHQRCVWVASGGLLLLIKYHCRKLTVS